MSKGIIDNKQSGIVGDILKENIEQGSKISIAAAHFTLYAFVELKKELSHIDEFRFIFTEPSFVEDSNGHNEVSLYGVREEQTYKADLTQSYLAKELTKWLKKKAQFKSVVDQRIEGGLYHVLNKDGNQVGLVGGAPFSSPGLGFSNSSNIYINNIVDEEATNQQLLQSFESIWENTQILKDVKDKIIKKLNCYIRKTLLNLYISLHFTISLKNS